MSYHTLKTIKQKCHKSISLTQYTSLQGGIDNLKGLTGEGGRKVVYAPKTLKNTQAPGPEQMPTGILKWVQNNVKNAEIGSFVIQSPRPSQLMPIVLKPTINNPGDVLTFPNGFWSLYMEFVITVKVPSLPN